MSPVNAIESCVKSMVHPFSVLVNALSDDACDPTSLSFTTYLLHTKSGILFLPEFVSLNTGPPTDPLIQTSSRNATVVSKLVFCHELVGNGSVLGMYKPHVILGPNDRLEWVVVVGPLLYAISPQSAD